jgi:hypothetical protein
MAKIVNKKTGETLLENSENCVWYDTLSFLEKNNYSDGYDLYKCLSNLIKTMAGDACTPFNTIKEMIEAIPDIVNVGEESVILMVFTYDTKGIHYFVLPWDYENNAEAWTKVLQEVSHDTDLEVIEN